MARAGKKLLAKTQSNPARFDYTPTVDILVGKNNYSDRVYWLKMILPAMAVAILLAISVWPNLVENETRFRITADNVADKAPQSSMIVGPNYVGNNGNGLVYNIKAAAAAPSPENFQAINLTNLQVNVKFENAQTLTIAADRSTYWRNRHGMATQGNIVIKTNQGHEIRTNAAYADFAQGIVWSDANVTGQSQQGWFTSQGFEAAQDGDRVVLRGKVKLNLLPTAPKAPLIAS